MADAVLALSHREYLAVDRNYAEAASSASLLYVSDKQPGISRIRKGKGFAYQHGNKIVRDEKEMARINKLAIPPSWSEVWICAKDNGHIQATGLDLRKRKQYRYHERWNSLRNETKFHRLFEFGKALPAIRVRMEEDLRRKGLTQDKVLATVVALMERTYIRVGNNEYEKIYGSYGLTTLKDKHVEIHGDKIVFSFRGKKGVHHNITLHNKRLARTVRQCRDIPGKELFQFYDGSGSRKPIDSGMVNDYIRQAAGMDFSAKDFRTWAGSLHALRAFRSLGEAIAEKDIRKNIVAMLDIVSVNLGNTRTVCRKYYVHPAVIRLYEENKLVKYLRELDSLEGEAGAKNTAAQEPGGEYGLDGLTAEEKVLMKIIRQYI